MNRRLGLLVLALVLTACSVTPTVTPEPTPTPTATIPSIPPTPFPTPSILPSPTVTRLAATPLRTPTKPSDVSTPPTSLDVPDRGWEVRTLLVGPGRPGRLYALLVDRWTDFQPSERMRFLISDDGGASWINFVGGLPALPPCVRNINLDYYTKDVLYGSTCQGLYRWKDNKWALISPQQTGMVAVVYGQPQNIWATNYADRTSPVISSRDGGITWQPAGYGLSHFNGVANVAIDPRDGRTLYAIIWPKYAGSYLRRGNAQGQWATMPTPMNNRQIDIGMTIDGATGALYVSAFGGESWQIWRTLNPTVDFNAIVWEQVYDFGKAGWVTMLASGSSPQAPGMALYARVSPDDADSYVSRSLDGGKTWAPFAIR